MNISSLSSTNFYQNEKKLLSQDQLIQLLPYILNLLEKQSLRNASFVSARQHLKIIKADEICSLVWDAEEVDPNGIQLEKIQRICETNLSNGFVVLKRIGSRSIRQQMIQFIMKENRIVVCYTPLDVSIPFQIFLQAVALKYPEVKNQE